jgi:hypothetical protein
MTGSTTAWHLISSPVGGQDIGAFFTSVDNKIAFMTGSTKYGLAPYVNNTPGWVYYTTATLPGAGNFLAGQGYEVLRTE